MACKAEAFDERTHVEIKIAYLLCDGSPDGETLESVSVRADHIKDRIHTGGDIVLLVAHRKILRILAVRWIGLVSGVCCSPPRS